MVALRPRTRPQTYVRLLNQALSVNTSFLVNNFLFYSISCMFRLCGITIPWLRTTEIKFVLPELQSSLDSLQEA